MPLQLAGLLLEHTDELGADDLALLSPGSLTPASLSRKRSMRIHIDQVGIHLVAEHVDDLLGLALAQQAVVHVHAGELFADGLDEQRGHHGGVHAARQGQQHLLVADLLADCGNLLVDEGLGEFGGGDAHHVVGTLVRIHAELLLVRGYALPCAAHES